MIEILQQIPRSWRTWTKVLSMFFQDALVYRANAVIWVLTDLVPAITMPLIWLASYNNRTNIHGFEPSQMVLYYLIILALSGFVESHIMWDMAEDVKQGKFNIYLTRPYSYMAYCYASNLGWRLMRLLISIPLFGVVTFAFRHYLHNAPQLHVGPIFLISVLLGHFVSFTLVYMIGLLSLWFYEVRSLYNFYYLPQLISSGQIAPLALLPGAWRHAIQWLPFPYTVSFPTEIALGRLGDSEIVTGLIMQIVWIAISCAVSVMLWRGGVRRFTAFGI